MQVRQCRVPLNGLALPGVAGAGVHMLVACGMGGFVLSAAVCFRPGARASASSGLPGDSVALQWMHRIWTSGCKRAPYKAAALMQLCY